MILLTKNTPDFTHSLTELYKQRFLKKQDRAVNVCGALVIWNHAYNLHSLEYEKFFAPPIIAITLN